MRALARAAGHTLDFTVISQERTIQASIAALRRAIDFFAWQQYRWNDHYLATLEPGYPVELTLAGIAGDQFMARSGAEILIGQTTDLPSPTPVHDETFLFEGQSPWE